MGSAGTCGARRESRARRAGAPLPPFPDVRPALTAASLPRHRRPPAASRNSTSMSPEAAASAISTGSGGDRRHFFADKPRHALGKDGNILAQASVANIGDIGAGQHGMDTRQRSRSRRVDRDDARAGMRAAQALADDRARHVEIAGIPGAAGHLGNPVHSFDRLADGLSGCPRCRHENRTLRFVMCAGPECIRPIAHCNKTPSEPARPQIHLTARGLTVLEFRRCTPEAEP